MMTKPTIFGIAALGVLLGACTDVSDVSPNVCGNRVIEPNEDCDTASAAGQGTQCGQPQAPNECFYVCNAETETVCPEGWSCGLDGRCRRPSGDLGKTASLSFPVDHFGVGDVDGDRFPDLVGSRGPMISVRFGDEDGRFEAELEVPSQLPVGPLAFGQLDGDDLMDIVVPIQGGLLSLLGRQSRELEPVPYSSLLLPNTQNGVRAFPLEGFDQDQNSEILSITSAGMRFFDNPSQTFLPFPGTNNALDKLARDIAIDNLLLSDELDEFVLAFAGDTAIHVCGPSTSSNEQALQPVCFGTLPVSQSRRVHPLGAQSMDVNGDGFPDIVVATSDQNGAGLAVEVFRHSPEEPNTFFVPAAVPKFLERSANPWPLASGDFDLDGVADYVFSDGIVVTLALDGLGLPSMFEDAVPAGLAGWNSSVVADFNGDDRPDVAVTLEGSDGIDFYLNAEGANNKPVFNAFHVNTDNPPVAMRTGDFDGDLVADLAFYENNGSLKPSRVSVIFGSTSGGPSDPIAMGSFDLIEVFEPVLSPFENLTGRDSISDLIVLSQPSTSPVRVATMLQGASSRHMPSPLFLADIDGTADRPIGALLGNFDPEDREGLVTDIATLALKATGPSQFTARGWLLHGIDGSGAVDVPAGPSLTLPPDRNSFDYLCTLWVAADTNNSDTLDEIIGIDSYRNANIGCTGSSPSQMIIAGKEVYETGNDEPVLLEPKDLGSEFSGVKTLLPSDMDGDGDQDILALFLDAPGDGKATVVVFWNMDGEFAGTNKSILPLEGEESRLDAAPAQLMGDKTPELLILTGEKVLLARFNPSTQGYDPTIELLDLEGQAGRIFVADANGDGLDDIITLNESAVQVTFQDACKPLGENDERQECVDSAL